MTDVATMEAGPAIDALVATEVMGWHYLEHEACFYTRTGKNPYIEVADWQPSTNDAYAFEALDHAGCHYSVAWYSGDVRVSLFAKHGECASVKVTAPTRPLAICRALVMWARARVERIRKRAAAVKPHVLRGDVDAVRRTIAEREQP